MVAKEGENRRSSYRWVVLAVYAFESTVICLLWLNFAAITSQTQLIMRVSEFKVVLLATIFPLVYIPVSIPAGMIIDRKGFRYAVLIGAVFMAGFSPLRLFVGNYTLVLIGTIGISLGQPFIINSITKLVSTWFPEDESALASGLGSMGLFLGMIIVLALTPTLLRAFGKDSLGSLRLVVLTYCLLSFMGLALFFLFARARPPKPIKSSAGDITNEVGINWKSLGTVLRLPDFRNLCVLTFIAYGGFVAILQLIEKICTPKGISSTGAGNIGAAVVFAGVVGCVALPAMSDKIGKRKPFFIIGVIVGAPAVFLLGVVNGTAATYLVGIAIGFFMLGVYPIMLIFSEETTGADLTGTGVGILLLVGNAGGVLFTLILEVIKGATGGHRGSFAWAMAFLAVGLVISLVFVLKLKEEHAPGAPVLPAGR